MGEEQVNWQILRLRYIYGEASLPGVSAGPILGPSLCNLSISDLEENSTSRLVRFADDAEIGRSRRTKPGQSCRAAWIS